jgi:ubiquinone/menaquinone biosynthesis C-methylase UbiE
VDIYENVAREYAGVFDDIRLRRYEWPWLLRSIEERRPQSLLDLGCGNGYLAKALTGIVPRLYAAEPCAALYSITCESLAGKADVRRAAAEELPFDSGSFDIIVSLVSFRYMRWEKALDEVRRALKPGGVFIVIDLFAARFNPFQGIRYLHTWIATRMRHIKNRDYFKKLSALHKNADWQKMIREYPKRELSEAKAAIAKKFVICEEKLLSLGLRGKTVGLVCKTMS